jgi:hypothetical protein
VVSAGAVAAVEREMAMEAPPRSRRTVVGRRLLVVIATLSMLTALAAPAMSQGPPPHPHMLVLGLEFDGDGEDPVGYRSCVDLAGNRKLPLHAHHDHIHTGRAGEALWGAGHAVVPGAPLTPWANCAELIAFFFGEE